ncbi:MAG: two-component system, chemotaxis family, CheB/CheR fusion protein [Phycisphaerales bacterium]|nr:two-component system, chemotaxis family, CheB/CheR fusion protein [Phycisphaerales bacterium]
MGYTVAGDMSKSQEITSSDFESLLEYIRRSRGFDFNVYKRAGLQRRVERRMQMVAVAGFSNYQDYLEVHPDEFTQLFNSILINVTGFFRDTATWDFVAKDLIPRILKNKKNGEPIRIWSAGCATGEEAYSIAMLLNEALGPAEFERRVKIFATDLDDDALNQARQASYSAHQVEAVPEELLKKYFEKSGLRYVFHKDVRRALIFGRHDLLQDAPISRVDLLTCRNALMYFNTEAQARVMERFHFALSDNGVLLLGKAEMLFTRLTLFTPLELKMRAFMKVPRGHVRDRLLVAAQGGGEPTIVPVAPGVREGEAIVDHMRIREAAFNIDPTAQIVIDADGFVALVNQSARAAFGLSDRDLGRALHELEVSYRPVDLRSPIDRARASRRAVEIKEASWPGPLPVPGGNGAGVEPRYVDVNVVPMMDAEGALIGLKISFTDVTHFKRLQEEVHQSHQELETAYEELQSTNEERETANEELQSTNEELETTNEEIQSTNEELETMNEELQSTNEELQATNEELQTRTDELTHANAFLSSILQSLRSGVVVVDRELKVRAWNPIAQEMWGLRGDEVTGKHFLDLDIGLPVEQLRAPIRTALGGTHDGHVIIPARNRRGREFQCRVTCIPASADGQNVSGVVLTMEEDVGT